MKISDEYALLILMKYLYISICEVASNPVFIGDDGILCLIHKALEINDVPKGPFLWT